MKRGLARATTAAVFTPGVVAQLNQIEADLGGRQRIIEMLVLAPLTKDLKLVLGMLGDPEQRGASLAEICSRGNILPGELLGQLQSAALLKGQVRAAQIIAEGTPMVVADIMRQAAPYQENCHACRGTGSYTPEPTKDEPNPSPGPCETCAGTGQLYYQANQEKQKLAMEMARLLPKGGGFNIALQQNNTLPGGSARGAGEDSFTRLQLLADRLLYGAGADDERSAPDEDPIDAPGVEVTDESSPE